MCITSLSLSLSSCAMFWRRTDGAKTVLRTVAASMLVISPLLLLDGGGTAREIMEGIFGPIGLRLLPITMLIFIQFLSSNQGVQCCRFLSGSPEAPSQLNGSSTGIALALLILLVLLYAHVFGGRKYYVPSSDTSDLHKKHGV